MTVPIASQLATTEEVETYLLRTFTVAERITVGAWLLPLSAAIRSRIPDIDQRIADGKLAIEVPKMVLSMVVKRLLDWLQKNAEQTGVTYPEFGATFRQDTRFGDFFTDQDWLMLGWVEIDDSNAAYSVPVTSL